MNERRTEIACCHVPAQHFPWQEPDPTVLSWQAAFELGIRHIRMDYKLSDLQWFEPAFRVAVDGGFVGRITANVGLLFDRDGGDIDATPPATVDAAAFDLVTRYGAELESVSFENEPGGKVGMSPQAKVLDISQGGTFDWIKDVYGALLLAFMRGARRANPDIRIDLFDSDSTEVQRRCMELLIGTEFEKDLNIRWTCHNYADIGGDPAKGIPSNQDYSSMAGMNGKPGFLSVFESDPLRRTWYISEISKATGPFGGIVTTSDMQRVYEYAWMMLTAYPQCPVITIMQPKCFFTRTPVWSARQPDISQPDADTWSTWTYGPKPAVSPEGAQLAALFGAFSGPLRIDGRQPGRGRR